VEDAKSFTATGESGMSSKTVVGIDIAKRVFQLHWVEGRRFVDDAP
jgi:hypothetical protein